MLKHSHNIWLVIHFNLYKRIFNINLKNFKNINIRLALKSLNKGKIFS